jgi:hypothetical protein
MRPGMWRVAALIMTAGFFLVSFVSPLRVAGTESRPEGGNSAAPQEQKTAPVIWTGKSGGFEIRWTTADIQARPLNQPDQVVFSAARLAHRGFQTFISPPNLDGSEERVTYERKFTIISVVGSIVSLKDELYYNIQPSAHPGGETRFTAIDLAKSGEAVYVSPPEADLFELDLAKLGKAAKLTDFFPETGVLKALLNNASIKGALGGESPSSLANLFKLLQDQRIEINNEVPYLFPRDFLTRFAFYSLQKNKVTVRLGLPSASGAARYWYAELGLLLPIPAALKESLTLAASGKEGFLMRDQRNIAGEGVTRLAFSIDTKGNVTPN